MQFEKLFKCVLIVPIFRKKEEVMARTPVTARRSMSPNWRPVGDTGKAKQKAVSRSARAGLQFPVGR